MCSNRRGMSDRVEMIKQRLADFAEFEAAGYSPLYAHLADRAAGDDDVAGLLTAAADADARPTLLLAAAHRLLQAEPIHPLSRYYPSLGGIDGVDSETWPLFREFLLRRTEQARELIAARVTQTNEVARAALLYPALTCAARDAGGPVALLDAGCSAGLLLGLDKFGYRYQCEGGEQLTAGPAKAAVGLHCALETTPGVELPKIPKKVSIGARVGLDRSPVDLRDEDELAWLEACVWADQPDRVRQLRMAASVQAKSPPELVRGDVADDLASTARRLPEQLPLVVMTSHVLEYLSPQRRDEFMAALDECASARSTWWVSQGTYESTLEHVLPGRDELRYHDGSGLCTLGMTRWIPGGPHATALARTAPHGQRLHWLGE